MLTIHKINTVLYKNSCHSACYTSVLWKDYFYELNHFIWKYYGWEKWCFEHYNIWTRKNITSDVLKKSLKIVFTVIVDIVKTHLTCLTNNMIPTHLTDYISKSASPWLLALNCLIKYFSIQKVGTV